MLASDEESGALDALRFSLASDIVELVVLTTDEAFLQTLREAVGGARRLWHVPSADKVSDLLVAGEVGILVLDVQTLNEAATVFVAQIKRQFPDLVVVVAGNRDAEISLAGLISAGIVYRFIHKPMSPGRAKLFADAAVKKYDDQRRRAVSAPATRNSRFSRGAVGACTVGVLAMIVAAAWTLHRSSRRDAGLESTAVAPGPGRADSPSESLLLAHAAAALAANRLTEPSGDNALELYLQARAQNPSDDAARSGLAEVRERLLAKAENALLEERLDEAAVDIETARKSGVERGRIAFLTAQLAKSREQVKTAQAAARARSAPQAEEDKATPSPAPAAQSLGAAQAPGSAAQVPGSAAQVPDTVERAQLNEATSIGFVSPESNATQHNLDDAVARQEFLSNVVTAGKLTLVKSVNPAYPKKAELHKTQGWVELDFTVAESGAVRDIAVHAASTPGVFEDAAIGALAQWRYKPVLRDAKPVAQRARIRIRFELAD